MNTASPDITRAMFDSSESLCAHLPELVDEQFGAHPFQAELSAGDLETLLPDYLAMSQAFPFLQAGAQGPAILDVIDNNGDMPVEQELTSVVGNFLCWDESGGHNVLMRQGMTALPRILETQRRFHANLFRRDAARILGRPVKANYSSATQTYLRALYAGLSSPDHVRRCAFMVAFEHHAGSMIDALWQSVSAVTDVPKDELIYFRVHVGGDDPAEKYHQDMTCELVHRIVPAESRAQFVADFLEAYALNVEWCRDLVSASKDASAVWHDGACHCGTVRFQVRAPARISGVRCNCSICEMGGFLHLMVPEEDFRILEGEDNLGDYQFNQRIARHTFCKTCGVKPFYRPRSNPEGYSANIRCLDRSRIEALELKEFDGQNWEENIAGLHRAAA